MTRYGTPDSKGETRRARNTRFGVDSPAMPKISAAGKFLFEIFYSINRGRPLAANGPQKIGHTDIESWCRLMNVELYPLEVSVLMDMSDAYLHAAYEEIRADAMRQNQ